MRLNQHLLGHTNARLGWIFAQQEVEMVEIQNLEHCISVEPRLMAEVTVESELTGMLTVEPCLTGEVYAEES